MEQLPYESYYQIIRDLDIKDIIHLCQTNIKLSKICQDPYTWRYLLDRDFGIEYNGPDPYSVYVRGWFLRTIDTVDIITEISLRSITKDPTSIYWLNQLASAIRYGKDYRNRMVNELFPPLTNTTLMLSGVLTLNDKIQQILQEVIDNAKNTIDITDLSLNVY